jgi:hypothetical protein
MRTASRSGARGPAWGRHEVTLNSHLRYRRNGAQGVEELHRGSASQSTGGMQYRDTRCQRGLRHLYVFG